jgi:hypothetical protein
MTAGASVLFRGAVKVIFNTKFCTWKLKISWSFLPSGRFSDGKVKQAPISSSADRYFEYYRSMMKGLDGLVTNSPYVYLRAGLFSG